MKLFIGILSDKCGAKIASVSMILLNALSLIGIYAGGLLHSHSILLISAFLFGSVYAVGAVGIALLAKYFFDLSTTAGFIPNLVF